MQSAVVAINSASPEIICQSGTTDSEASRNTMTSGVEGGKKDIQVAILPLGSRTICNQVNIGSDIRRNTGSNIDWASFISFTEAPIAMKIELNRSTARTW